MVFDEPGIGLVKKRGFVGLYLYSCHSIDDEESDEENNLVYIAWNSIKLLLVEVNLGSHIFL